MKQILAFLFGCFAFLSVNAQIEPVKWTTEVEKISDTEYNLIYKAAIEDHWHLYSQTLPEGGAIPTEFIYDEKALDTNFELVGKANESKSITKFDKVFQMDLTYFDNEATFTQKIKLKNPQVTAIEAEISFQACDDAKCIFESEIVNFQLTTNQVPAIFDPVKWSTSVKQLNDTHYQIQYTAKLDPKWHIYSQDNSDPMGPIATEFTFKDNDNNDYQILGPLQESETVTKYENAFKMDVTYFEDKAVFTQKIKVLNPAITKIEAEVYYQACDDEKCLAPTTFEFATNLDGSETLIKTLNIDPEDLKKSKALNLGVTGWDNYKKEEVKEKTNFGIFILGFIGGLIALLTPCVFPMIPLTVSFFTKSAENTQKGLANAIIYGVFILIIYVLLSLPFHFLDSLNPEILNTISTNVWLNIIFFLILAFFAFSFFGYYEITLPSSWGNKMDETSSRVGGIIGIFFMALTLAIVSFSCTGPILGSLLAGSLTSDGGAMQLTAGMSGFGLALALPFTLFAMFPKWLNSLPKSGGWLNTVKVVLGFLELGMAFKFLSNADLVKHWGLLKREIFIGIWIIIGIGLLLYLLGKIKFPHDSPIKKLSFSRISFAVLVGAFVIYLIPGLTNTKYANLKLLSGFPPPLPYSIYEKDSECPLGLNCYKDIDEGIVAAKEANKPIMLDFTGWACVNCRKMEEQVWSQDKIYEILKEEYIIVSLYVDDRKKLPENEQFKFVKANGNLKNIKTIGDKWATLQTLNFQNNSQPYYVLLNENMELLNHTTAYTPDADEYLEWLKKGLENFKK
ncbi:thioredoxin family protein [Olleya sp. YS]|uniref:protein-disulfide reductase DsbD family protein n=1 Tax=Olleya sp. YS TaxID=3028318 RepID=UPI0024345747|nr:thioredoxin family protein [Olleya sp. YS]WGD34689.1 protein-disulfide reductase DsbD family protein [Olleya sp. YS]